VGEVRYEIHLHPTYQVPCLWFSLHELPPGESPLHIDTVFRRLVPDQYKEGLRSSVGGIGGISIDVRPLPLFAVFADVVLLARW
jgi:ubiquitin-like-conjugating enzyme ATG10